MHHGGWIPGVPLGQVRCQIPPLSCCQALRPAALIKIIKMKKRKKKSPRCDFCLLSLSSVAAVSIIPHSQQTPLLVKDVNLWVARSPPQPFISPSRREEGRAGMGGGLHIWSSTFKKNLSHRRERGRDAIHILNASVLFLFIADVSCMTLAPFEVLVEAQLQKKKKKM